MKDYWPLLFGASALLAKVKGLRQKWKRRVIDNPFPSLCFLRQALSGMFYSLSVSHEEMGSSKVKAGKPFAFT